MVSEQQHRVSDWGLVTENTLGTSPVPQVARSEMSHRCCGALCLLFQQLAKLMILYLTKTKGAKSVKKLDRLLSGTLYSCNFSTVYSGEYGELNPDQDLTCTRYKKKMNGMSPAIVYFLCV